METGVEVQSRLLLPPPLASRVVRRPLRNGRQLVTAALGAAARTRGAWALLALAQLLRLAGSLGPALVFVGAVRLHLAAGSDPIAAVLQAAADPAVLLVGGGLWAAAFFASFPVGAAGAALGLPRLRALLDGQEASEAIPFGEAFGRIVGAAILVGLVALVATAAALPPIVWAAQTWAQAHEAGAGAGLLASTAFALVLVLVLAGSLLLRLVADAAVARAGAFGDRPVAAVAEALALVLRRPLPFLLAFYLLALAGLLAGTLFAFPSAMAPTPGSALVLRGLAQIVLAIAAGLFALARLGVFVAAVNDEA